MKDITQKISRSIETICFLCSRDPVLLNGWFNYRFNILEHRNFGDELNIYILQELLPDKKLFNLIDTCRWGTQNATNYLVIGSLIEEFSTPNSIIWGAGVIEGNERILRNKPREVKAVRGHKTREYLLKNRVDCPEIYGDPALLTPLVYDKEVSIKYELGIIPHVSEVNHSCVKRLEQNGVHVIRFDQYAHWHDVINEIRACQHIVSSSLHGLILSDAYSIPNGWIALEDQLLGGHFKFLDYFSSVHREQAFPFKISDNVSKQDLLNYVSEWQLIDFDPMPLIDSAPWQLNIDKANLYAFKSYTKHHHSSL